MSNTESVAIYRSMGTIVTLYNNRLELKLPGGLFGKKEMIPYRSITTIEKPPLLNCIDIHTADGRKHRISLLKPSETIKLKEHIESLL